MTDYATKPIPASKPPTLQVQRPWGQFLQFAHNTECTVSLMTVQPGKRLSLQAHSGRAELWIVLDDGALVQTGEQLRHCQAGDEIWIGAQEKHRLTCTAPHPIRVLEVAFGNWQQADIQRYGDDFERPTHGE